MRRKTSSGSWGVFGETVISPQPLSSYGTGGRRPLIYTSANASVRERPRHALLAANVIASAGALDAYLSSLLVSFLGSTAKPSFAMFEAIHQTAKNQALKAAARVRLSAEDNDTFNALLLILKAPDKHRNRIAHWLWAFSEDIEDGLLLIDPAANFDFLVRTSERLEAGERVTRSPTDLDRKRVLVYKVEDLSRIVEEYQVIRDWFMVFKQHITPELKRDEWQYRAMLDAPAFRQALVRIRPPTPPKGTKELLSKLRKPAET